MYFSEKSLQTAGVDEPPVGCLARRTSEGEAAGAGLDRLKLEHADKRSTEQRLPPAGQNRVSAGRVGRGCKEGGGGPPRQPALACWSPRCVLAAQGPQTFSLQAPPQPYLQGHSRNPEGLAVPYLGQSRQKSQFHSGGDAQIATGKETHLGQIPQRLKVRMKTSGKQKEEESACQTRTPILTPHE